jgi:hypothetical protein
MDKTEQEVERTAAICGRCEEAIAVRINGDGELRPIGGEKGECCSCAEPDLRAMNDATEILDDPRPTDRSE